jgi:DNA-directed RNA polymerase specialized sigma subunit
MKFILGLFGGSNAAGQKKYRIFVEEVIGKEVESPLNAAVAATILGSDDFVAEIQERHVTPKPIDRNLPALRQLVNRPDISRIIEAAKEAFDGNERLAGKAAIHLCHKFSGAKLREIGERFGVKDSAVSQASKRFMMEASKDEELKRKVAKLMKSLGLSIV